MGILGVQLELHLYCHVLNVTFSDFIGLPKNETADSAQPRNRSTVTRPFSSLEGGVWGRDYVYVRTHCAYANFDAPARAHVNCICMDWYIHMQ